MTKDFDPYGDSITHEEKKLLVHTMVLCVLAAAYIGAIRSTGHGLWFDTSSTYGPWLVLEGLIAFLMVTIYYISPIAMIGLVQIFVVTEPLLEKFEKWVNTEPDEVKERKPLVKRTVRA